METLDESPSTRHAPFIRLEWRDGRTTVRGERSFRSVQAGSGGFRTEWHFDDGQLFVRSDPLGFWPCFYWAEDNALIISPSIEAIFAQGVAPSPDLTGIAVLLYHGQLTGDLTPFSGIRALPPDAALSWRQGRLTVAGNYRFPEPCGLSRREALERYIELFRESLRQSLTGNESLVVPLTGGRDSRHILFEAVHQGRRPAAVVTAEHYPVRSNDDLAVAGEVCAELGLPHTTLPLPRLPYPAAHAAKLPRLEWLSMQHLFSLPILDYLSENPGLTLLDGLGGDILSAGLYLSEGRHSLYAAGRLKELAQSMCRSHAAHSLLNREWSQRIERQTAVAAVAEELARHKPAPNPVTSYLFWNRTRRDVALAPLKLMSGTGASVVTPFVTLDLYDLLASLPPHMVWDHEFHNEALRRAYPQWAHLRFEDKSAQFSEPSRISRESAMWAAANVLVGGESIFDRRRLLLYVSRALLMPRPGAAWWSRQLIYLHSLWLRLGDPAGRCAGM